MIRICQRIEWYRMLANKAGLLTISFNEGGGMNISVGESYDAADEKAKDRAVKDALGGAGRAIDSLLVMGITALVLLLEMSTFGMFFRKTGTNLQSILGGFSWAGYLVVAICGLAILVLLHFLLHKLSIYDKVRATLTGIWQGVISLKDVRNIPLFVFFTIGIWVSYFLHYYLTFFCFDFTADLGLGCALVTFIVGSIAVIVPTPNGAGPWHFAVKTMLILYGVADEKALYFVLIVHTVQTLLVVVLGIYAWLALNFTKVRRI